MKVDRVPTEDEGRNHERHHDQRGRAAEPSPRLYNEDLAPTRERTWGTYSLFAMWMSDVHSIGGYTFAAGLFFTGLVGWQVFVALMSASPRSSS